MLSLLLNILFVIGILILGTVGIVFSILAAYCIAIIIAEIGKQFKKE